MKKNQDGDTEPAVDNHDTLWLLPVNLYTV